MTLSTIFWLLVFGIFIYMMIKNGGCCGGGHNHGGHDHGSNEHEGHDGPEAGHNHKMELENDGGGSVKDPVCGMDVNSGSFASEHLGRSFHFCSEQCRKLFDLNPNKYLETHGS